MSTLNSPGAETSEWKLSIAVAALGVLAMIAGALLERDALVDVGALLVAASGVSYAGSRAVTKVAQSRQDRKE